MEVTFHGHSCVQITSQNYSIIIDPFLTGNPKATSKADDIKVHYVLLTHAHSDHMGDTIEIAKRNDATVIATFELATYLSWQGVKTFAMNTGGAHDFEFGHVKLTKAYHSSGFVDEKNKEIIYMGMPNGILVTIDGKTIYHAGDTDLFYDMKLIGERNLIDLAFLPIGDNFTMGPEDAVIAAGWLHANRIVPIHYNTFSLINQDGENFVKQLEAKNIKGLALKPGERFSL